MPFSETEKLICKYNENPSAKLPNSGDIGANKVSLSNNIVFRNDIEMFIFNEDLVIESFTKEYKKNNKNNIYFFGCNFETYKFNYNRRLNEFLEKSPDSIEPEFIISELGLLKKSFDFPFVDSNIRSNIMSSMRRRDEFLLDRLDVLGYEYVGKNFLNYDDDDDENEPEYFKMYHVQRKSDFMKTIVEQPELSHAVDFGDSKCTEKIIWIYLLGELDRLRKDNPFNTSTNKLASAISGMIGEPVVTIQSYINPIFSDKSDQKNNPLRNIEKVEIVRQKLISLGFKPIK